MKIENSGKVHVLDHLVKSANAQSPKTGAAQKEGGQQVVDKVELSNRKNEIDSLKEKVKAAPATRQDKIDAIKEAIANGTYEVKGEDIARSMLKSQILDELLKP